MYNVLPKDIKDKIISIHILVNDRRENNLKLDLLW